MRPSRCCGSAVEGGAYTPDPLTYIIDALINERKLRTEMAAAAAKVQAVMRGRKSRRAVVSPALALV